MTSDTGRDDDGSIDVDGPTSEPVDADADDGGAGEPDLIPYGDDGLLADDAMTDDAMTDDCSAGDRSDPGGTGDPPAGTSDEADASPG